MPLVKSLHETNFIIVSVRLWSVITSTGKNPCTLYCAVCELTCSPRNQENGVSEGVAPVMDVLKQN
jgi:hypothetical protein